jgi:hypothetical protein
MSCQFYFSVLDIQNLAVVQFFTKGLNLMINFLVVTGWLLKFLTSWLHTYNKVEFGGPVYFIS